jgi:hypothetical protein
MGDENIGTDMENANKDIIKNIEKNCQFDAINLVF